MIRFYVIIMFINNVNPCGVVKRKVIVIDCDVDVTFSVKRILEDTGVFEVDAFNSPAQALSSFVINSYDVVILDVKMRDMDGFRLYEKIKLLNKKVKVCFLNSVFDFSPYIAIYPDILDTIEDNGDRIVDKPVGSKQLIREINKLDST
jgi:DNA-binding response OmpR family regulator